MNKSNLRKTGAADTAMIWNFGTQSRLLELMISLSSSPCLTMGSVYVSD